MTNENKFQYFAFIVEKLRINVMADKSDSNLLLKERNYMKLKNRERGSDNGVCKYNKLTGRWFEKTGLSVPKEDSGEIVKKKVIESDPVISIEQDVGVFLVFVVWREDSPGN